MIYDILEVFRKEYKEKGDKLILDNYELKDGLYVKINENEHLEYFIFKNDKKEEHKYNCLKDLHGGLNSKMYEWFKERDYYSSYLNSNKAFNDKKIHNVNYLSLFVKIESFTSNELKKKLPKNALKNHYKALCDYKKFNKHQEREILEGYQTYLQDRMRRKDIIKKYKFLKNYLPNIVETALKQDVSNYIKIFFDAPIEQYQEESEIYYAIKIFNDISYSKTFDDKVYGLSDYNLGLGGGIGSSSKKPFYHHRTRKEDIPPFMIKKENALLVKKFSDWLKFQDLKEKKPLATHQEFFINRDYMEKDKIIDYDYIPVAIDRLDESIIIKNHLMLKKDKMLIEDKTYEYLSLVEKMIHEVLYNRQLINNYYGEVYNKLDHKFASFIYMTRDAMVNYFKKFDDRAFYQVVEKYATYLAIEHLLRGRLTLAGESLNIKFSLREHKQKGEKNMNIKAMQQTILDKVQDSNYEPLSKDEFFYLCGQVAKYLLSKNKSGKKDADMLEPFLKVKNINKLKDELKFTFYKYKHEIGLNQTKFNNALSLITAYEGEDKLDNDSFLVGLLSQNIFYMKSKEEEKN